METIRKAKREYYCMTCSGVIRKGNLYKHTQLRIPNFNDDGVQIGIKYISYRECNKDCFQKLVHFSNTRKIIKECNYGIHTPIWDLDPDSTDNNIYCKWCGIQLESIENPIAKLPHF